MSIVYGINCKQMALWYDIPRCFRPGLSADENQMDGPGSGSCISLKLVMSKLSILSVITVHV